ncbi:MAG: hypothetical protein AAGD32_17430 [Planctomycetota bacterium]
MPDIERHPDLLTPAQAATRAGLKSPRSFQKWRRDVCAPRIYRSGNDVYYWKAEVDLAIRLRAEYPEPQDLEVMRKRRQEREEKETKAA